MKSPWKSLRKFKLDIYFLYFFVFWGDVLGGNLKPVPWASASRLDLRLRELHGDRFITNTDKSILKGENLRGEVQTTHDSFSNAGP